MLNGIWSLLDRKCWYEILYFCTVYVAMPSCLRSLLSSSLLLNARDAMTNDIIFYTQIGSIVGFLFALFAIYRLLVAQKDSVIELLREKIASKDDKIKSLESLTPDALTASLSSRISIALTEIERLKADGDKHKDEVTSKTDEMHLLEAQLTGLLQLIQGSELVCNRCGAPLSRRASHTILGHAGGREVEADIEFIEYECGSAFEDGREVSPCGTWLKPMPD